MVEPEGFPLEIDVLPGKTGDLSATASRPSAEGHERAPVRVLLQQIIDQGTEVSGGRGSISLASSGGDSIPSVAILDE